MKSLLPYRVVFVLGISAFVGSFAMGLTRAVRHTGGVPGLPPGALDDYRYHFAQGELRRAARAYRVATRIDPTNFPNAPELADAMRRAGDEEGEIEQYRLARERWPRDPATHRALGRAYCRYRRFDEGMASLREALRLGERDANTYIALGDAWMDQGRFAEAVPAYSEAVKLAGQSAEAHNRLGLALALSREAARAAAEFAEAFRLEPQAEYAANLERARQDALMAKGMPR